MKPITPSTSDAAREKHVPVVAIGGPVVTVTVGSVEHPMMDAHYIQWIMLETMEDQQRKTLRPGDAPMATLALTEGNALATAYEYCNLHGLRQSI